MAKGVITFCIGSDEVPSGERLGPRRGSAYSGICWERGWRVRLLEGSVNSKPRESKDLVALGFGEVKASGGSNSDEVWSSEPSNLRDRARPDAPGERALRDLDWGDT